MLISADVSLREDYTDNLFLNPFIEEDDFITTISPSFNLHLETSPVEGKLTYGLDYKKYLDHSSEDETDLQDIQRGEMDLTLLPNRDFSIALYGNIDRVTIDERGPESERNSLVNMSNRYLVKVRPNYRRKFTPTLTGELAYQFDMTDYESPAGDDTLGHTIELILEKKMSNTLKTDLKGSWSKQEDDFSADYQRQDLTLGSDWKANPSLGIVARVGGIRLDYDNEDASIYGIGKLEVSIGELKPWQTVLSYGQDYLLSSNDGLMQSRTAEARLVRDGRLRGELSVYQTINDFQSVDRKDEYDGTRLKLGYDLSRSLVAILNGNYRYQNYQPENEGGHRYGGGGECAYLWKNYRIAFGYAYTENRSTVAINSYRENLFYLQGSFSFGSKPVDIGE